MYPNDNRYPDSMPNMDNMNLPMYNTPMRNPSLDMNNNRPQYYDPTYYDKAPPIMQPMYDYMNQPPMMPMNQGIDPRYSNWRQSSENRGPIMPTYYDNRPPISEPYMHSKPPMPNLSPYPETYPSHEPLNAVRPAQMNILQRISYLIKPQLPELKKTMSRALSSAVSGKKKQSSRRERSRQRQREREGSHKNHRDHRDRGDRNDRNERSDRGDRVERDRSNERSRKASSSGLEWVCSKCSFLNFDWREKCKKCDQSKPSFPLGKNFIPGPEDWKCVKCGNLNYARRVQCNRCKLPKSNNNR